MTDAANKFYSISKSGKFKTKISRRISVANDKIFIDKGIKYPIKNDQTAKSFNQVIIYLVYKMMMILPIFI